MIVDREIASDINDLVLDIAARLDRSVAMVQQKCSPEELNAYRRGVAKVLGEILFELMHPLYGCHPSLKPPGLD